MKLYVLILILFVTGCASIEQQKNSNIKKARNLSLNHFISHLTVQDDKFIPTATITTGKGFQAKWGVAKMVWSDQLLRAHLDKKTKTVSYEVYLAYKIPGGTWTNPIYASYSQPVIKKNTKKISSNVDCSAQQLYGGCVFSEDVTFSVSRRELERVLAPEGQFPYIDEADAWTYAVQTKSRGVMKSIFVKNEIKALLQGVDFYLKQGPKALSEAVLKAKGV